MKRTALIVTLAVFGLMPYKPALSQDGSEKSIPETAVAAGNFNTLVAAVKAAELLETLGGNGPFTVLAPTDEAFAKLPKGTVEELVKPENKEKLVAILKLHVASGELTSNMAQPGGEFPTLAGTPLKVDIQGDEISVGGAKVIKADIACSNGVIHVIDTVILPNVAVDPKMIVGTWTYTKAVENGTSKDADQLEGQSVEITKDSWTLNGEAKFVMDYEIDANETPNKIKFTITESPFGAGMSTGGLIKMVGDELVVCYSARGGAAPTEFASESNSGVNMFHLKKSK